MHVSRKFKEVLSDKWRMVTLSNDLSTLLRLHILGHRKTNQTRQRLCESATALRLRPFEGRPLWCRPGTSDLAVLWEVLLESEYSIPPEFARGVRTVLDLGANVGYSMLYFSQCYPSARIVGVEPDTDNVQVARRNIKSVGLGSRCEVIEAAVWCRDALVTLDRASPEYAFSLQREVAEHSSTVQAHSIPVLMRLANFARIDLLKMNIEGSERAVLESANCWADRVSCVICELHGEYTFDDFQRSMHSNGFRCFRPGTLPGLKVPLAVR